MKLILNAPINSLSFGNVSLNLLRAMYDAKDEVCHFPISNNADLKAFDKLDENFFRWMQSNIQSRFDTIRPDMPTLKLWHINGSETRYTSRQYLYTFYELNRPTKYEINLLNLQDHIFVSSSYTKQILQFSGIDEDKITFAPLGFDPDFGVTNKKYGTDGYIHFGLMGKWEKRKHTANIISLWAKKYGNNPKYRLTCCVTNPFLNADQLNKMIGNTLEGRRYYNIDFLPPLPLNSQVNDLINSIDVDLTGLSGAEGWNLPAFNATALGKWSVVLNATAHKDWANKNNSILVSPNGMTSSVDNVFFKAGEPFNQGDIFTWDENEVASAMEFAETKAKTKNVEGLKLQEEFTYKKTLSKIKEKISEGS